MKCNICLPLPSSTLNDNNVKIASMKSTLGERIKKSRESAGLTQAQLGSHCDVSRVAVSQWESGDTKSLKVDNLLKAARVLKKSFRWLAEGKGPEDDDASSEFETVPMVESFYHGGDGDGMNAANVPRFIKNLSFRRDWLEYEGLRAETLKVAMVHGDSMSPSLQEADVILVDKDVNSLARVKNGTICALTVDGKPLVKRVFKQDMGGVLLRSDNGAYQDISLAESETGRLEIIGQVVWSGGRIH